MGTRRGLAGGFAAFAVAVSMTGAAWACTGSPARVSSLGPQIGRAGSEVRVAGGNFGGAVELRWNSVNGPLLATAADGSNFSVPVRVPADAGPGVFYVVAVQRSLAGDVLSKVSHTFEVVSASGSGPAAATERATANLWRGLTPADSSASLADDSPAPAPGRTSSGLSIGMVLLAVGLVTMFSGVLMAEMRRRRVPTAKSQ